MPLTILDGSERIPAERGGVVVVIPIYGAHDLFTECIRSVLLHTPTTVPMLVTDDASPDDRSRRLLQELNGAGVLECDVYYTRASHNRGFVSTVNDAFDRAAPADIVVVNSDCVVTAGWLEAMTSAAYDSTLVATVSAFTNHGTILSLPIRNRPQPALPQTTDLDRAAEGVQTASMRLRPRLPTVVGHCFYVKRSALDLVGPFDMAFSPGYGEEVDFAQRCVLHGLVHVVADDTFVLHRGSASFAVDGKPNPIKRRHDRMIHVRYPYYYKWVRQVSAAKTTPLARALGAAQRSLRGLTVTIDGRCLTPILTGTQVHTLEVIAALSRLGGPRLRVVVPHDLGDYAHAVLGNISHLDRISQDAVDEGTERDDVVHRPFQISSQEDLSLLARLGEKIVVTHQDLISFNNPGYFGSFELWSAHRRLARHALALADRVVFFSRTAAEEAIAEQLVDRDYAAVVPIGTDHTIDAVAAVEEPPSGITKLCGRPFLLCLGTDFAHKNRAFALGLLAALRESHAWDGGLVFAGPHVLIGSSASEEASFLALHPELSDVVLDVASVGEGTKRWLLRHAALMVFPSVHEGFGLVPFEAADAGLACAFAAQTAVGELLPSSLALIEQWDAPATAARVVRYLQSDALRAEHVAAVRAAAAPLTWKRTAKALIEVYVDAARSRSRESRRLVEDYLEEHHELEAVRAKVEAAQQELVRERAEFRKLEQGYRHLRSAYDETAEGLVGPNGVIPSDLRRPLLAIGHRRLLRAPLFGLLRLLYAAGYRMRHVGRAPPR